MGKKKLEQVASYNFELRKIPQISSDTCLASVFYYSNNQHTTLLYRFDSVIIMWNDSQRSNCYKIVTRGLIGFLLAMVLVGLVINRQFFMGIRVDDDVPQENPIEQPTPSVEVPVSQIQIPTPEVKSSEPNLQRPRAEDNLDDVAYIRAYLSPEANYTRHESQPPNITITCDNSTETIYSYYMYVRNQAGGINHSPLTCGETFRRTLCSGYKYLEDPRLTSILNSVSPYLTSNVLTENDLRMASLALEFKNQPRSTYQPDYENPKVAYVLMSAHSPSLLQFTLDHIHSKARPHTILLSTYDYNAPKINEYNQILQDNPDVKNLSTRFLGNWGGISLVYFEVSAWLELLKMDGWDYVINLSDTDSFIVPADIVEQRLKELNGTSVIECPYTIAYSQGHDDKCTRQKDSGYRYKDAFIECGSSVRAAVHPMLKPVFPKYVSPRLKSSQWKVYSRSVIEKLVTSQDFWDILFSYRYSLVPDEHVMINAAKRILPNEPFIYHNIHYKNWTNKKVDEAMTKEAIKQGSWFIRKCDSAVEYKLVARVRDEEFATKPPVTF